MNVQEMIDNNAKAAKAYAEKPKSEEEALAFAMGYQRAVDDMETLIKKGNPRGKLVGIMQQWAHSIFSRPESWKV